jgi:hypothetical protein
VIPQVSPFLGTYYTLQQWCNTTSVRAFASAHQSTATLPVSSGADGSSASAGGNKTEEDGCVLAQPPDLGALESEIFEALRKWMSLTCAELGLTDLVSSSSSANGGRGGMAMTARLANFAACAGAGGGLDYNGSHGCHTLLLPKQWQAICLAIGAPRHTISACLEPLPFLGAFAAACAAWEGGRSSCLLSFDPCAVWASAVAAVTCAPCRRPKVGSSSGGYTCYSVPLPPKVLDGAATLPIAEDELRSLLVLLRDPS